MRPEPVPEYYYCPGCSKHFGGQPKQKLVLDSYYEEGTEEDEVGWDTVIECHDRPVCTWTNYDPIIRKKDGWFCGECGKIYDNLPDAIGCCV